ncbi:hypothetical protein HZH66_015351 [Vespula vulgaris]|uniref:Uncharacterized protein n=1 Tax=Vespula vulgaris TaxID=7454 RepID=A0A834IXD1_VESVU|nr:hypothetical protein HZH66_015351 [Vespula vulgaris]
MLLLQQQQQQHHQRRRREKKKQQQGVGRAPNYFQIERCESSAAEEQPSLILRLYPTPIEFVRCKTFERLKRKVQRHLEGPNEPTPSGTLPRPSASNAMDVRSADFSADQLAESPSFSDGGRCRAVSSTKGGRTYSSSSSSSSSSSKENQKLTTRTTTCFKPQSDISVVTS